MRKRLLPTIAAALGISMATGFTKSGDLRTYRRKDGKNQTKEQVTEALNKAEAKRQKRIERNLQNATKN